MSFVQRSGGEERLQHVADIVVHNEVGLAVEVGRLAIEDHQTRAVSFGQSGKSRGGPND